MLQIIWDILYCIMPVPPSIKLGNLYPSTYYNYLFYPLCFSSNFLCHWTSLRITSLVVLLNWFLSASRGMADSLKNLLNNGVSFELASTQIFSYELSSSIPVQLKIQYKAIKVFFFLFRYLLKSFQAKVNVRESLAGGRPLHIATKASQLECIKLLVS